MDFLTDNSTDLSSYVLSAEASKTLGEINFNVDVATQQELIAAYTQLSTELGEKITQAVTDASPALTDLLDVRVNHGTVDNSTTYTLVDPSNEDAPLPTEIVVPNAFWSVTEAKITSDTDSRTLVLTNSLSAYDDGNGGGNQVLTTQTISVVGLGYMGVDGQYTTVSVDNETGTIDVTLKEAYVPQATIASDNTILKTGITNVITAVKNSLTGMTQVTATDLNNSNKVVQQLVKVTNALATLLTNMTETSVGDLTNEN